MAGKRKVDDILNETLPENSKELYLKRWGELMDFMGEPTRRPTETDFIQYFDYLKVEKGQAASSLWSIYSSLNSVYQREFSDKLQSFPRIAQLLKSYTATYTRKVASIFQSSDVDNFLNMELSTNYWTVRKAVVGMALAGGLRCAEVGDVLRFRTSLKSTTNLKFPSFDGNSEEKRRGPRLLSPYDLHVTLLPILWQ